MRTLSATVLLSVATVLASANAAATEDFGCECLAHRLEAAPARNRDQPRIGADPNKGKFDAATGADFRHWPPDRLVDTKKLKVELTLPDLPRCRWRPSV
ncbi:MAG: hypothetical protein LW625_08340 [Planctomycetaceae bacterium]|nr:hypothetical protein [Planctomycetaceae bacterium]